MKENRFRAWDNDAGRFTYSHIKEDLYVWGFEGGKLKAWAIVENQGSLGEPPYPDSVELEPPEQSSDFKDKNEEEVYKGDFLKIRTYEFSHCKKDGEWVSELKYERFCNGEVVFGHYTTEESRGGEVPHYGWCCNGEALPSVLEGVLCSNTHHECLGVVGNIHQHPELLEEK